MVSLSQYGYIVPHDRSYALPTFTADSKQLHFGARYNYEDKETGSLWFGYNFSAGDKLALEVTPMIGGVFGNTAGIAPGYKASLTGSVVNSPPKANMCSTQGIMQEVFSIAGWR